MAPWLTPLPLQLLLLLPLGHQGRLVPQPQISDRFGDEPQWALFKPLHDFFSAGVFNNWNSVVTRLQEHCINDTVGSWLACTPERPQESFGQCGLGAEESAYHRVLFAVARKDAPDIFLKKCAALACNETLHGNGMDYRGCASETRTGRTCQSWTVHSPHAHINTPDDKPGMGLGDHNQCRNPDGLSTIWCYTTDPDSRWEYCNPQQVCDWQCYLDRYPDLGATSTAAAESHYVNVGKKEGRDCSCRHFPHCDWQCYLDRYPLLMNSLNNSHVAAKRHYESFGQAEGRDCTCPGFTEVITATTTPAPGVGLEHIHIALTSHSRVVFAASGTTHYDGYLEVLPLQQVRRWTFDESGALIGTRPWRSRNYAGSLCCESSAEALEAS